MFALAACASSSSKPSASGSADQGVRHHRACDDADDEQVGDLTYWPWR